MAGRQSSQRVLCFLLAGLVLTGFGSGLAESEPPLSPGVRLGSPEPPLAQGMQATPRGAADDSADLTPPQVTIRVRAAATIVVGQDLEYRILVENRARAPAHHVVVRASAPTFATFVKATPEQSETKLQDERYWQFGTLAAGATKEIVIVVKPTGEGEISCCARVAFEHGQCVRTKLARADPKRTGLTAAALNDILTYEVVVANPFATPMKDVVLSETLSAGLLYSESNPSPTGDNPLVWKLGTIEPGRSKKVIYKIIAQGMGKQTIAGKVLMDGKTAGEATTTVTVDEPRLVVAITGPARRLVHRSAVYQITVTNPGTLPLTGVKVVNVNLVLDKKTDEPATMAFLSADQGGKRVGKKVEWSLGTLKPGEKRVLRLELKADMACKLTHRIEAYADPKVKAEAETTTEYEIGAALDVELGKDAEVLEIGKKTTCTINIVNAGSAAATNVGLTFTVPEGLKGISAQGPAGEQKIEGAVIQFPMMGKLEAGKDVKYSVEMEALKKGPVRLKADATSDQTLAAPIHCEEALTVVED